MKLEFLEKLDARERRFALFAALFLLLVLTVIGISSFYNFRTELRQKAERSKTILHKLLRIKSQIASISPLQSLPEKNRFLAQINSLLQNNGLSPTSINEKAKAKQGVLEVAIRLQSVDIHKLLQFLYSIEYNSHLALFISRFRIRKLPAQKELYDVELTVSLRGEK